MAQEDKINEILDRHSDNLSEEQLRALPLLAFGMKPAKVAKSINVSDTTIRQWMRTDAAFRTAMTEFADHVKFYHMAMLNQAAVRAWDRIFEYLDTDYPEEDRIGRTNQAQTAKFVISELGIMKQEPEPEKASPQLNITEDSADIIARKVHELQQQESKTINAKYDVQDSFDEDDPRTLYNSMDKAKAVDGYGEEFENRNESLYPKFHGTEYGEITYNTDGTRARCHICGEWEIDLVVHIRHEHKLSPARYREMYKIPSDIKLGLFKPVVASKQDIANYNKELESTMLDTKEEDNGGVQD